MPVHSRSFKLSVVLCLAMAFVGCFCNVSRAADESLFKVEKIEGRGVVEIGRGSDELSRLEAEGEVTIGYLQDNGLLPDRFWTMVSNAAAGDIDIRPWNVITMKAKLIEAEKAVEMSKAAVDMASAQSQGQDDEMLAGVQESIKRAKAALKEAEWGLRQFRDLYNFMESRGYMTWKPVAVGTWLPAGSAIRTGGGSEAVLMYKTGAVTRVKENTTFAAQPLRFQATPMSVVYGRLWQGICEFYFPPNAEAAKKFEIDTNMVYVGIKGTEFSIQHIEGVSTVTVKKGSVEVRTIATGAIRIVSAGESFTVGAAAKATGAIPAGWVRESRSGLSFVVPGDWNPMPEADAGQGGWLKGSFDNPDAAFGLLRETSFQEMLEEGEIESQTSIMIAGRAATHYRLTGEDAGIRFKGWLIPFAQPEADGKYIVLIFMTPERNWPTYGKVFQTILDSISGGGGDSLGNVGSGSYVPEYPVQTTPDTSGLTEQRVGQLAISVPTGWRSISAEGVAEAAWVLGDENEPDVAVSVWADPDADVLTESFDLSGKVAITIGGRAATRYDLRIDEPPVKGWLIVFDGPDADGQRRAIMLAAPVANWPRYEATLTKVAASIRPGSAGASTPVSTTSSGGGFSDDFKQSSLGSDWTVVDDPSPSGPSDWSISNGKLVQSSNIYRVGNEFDYYQGTHIVANASAGSDYEVACDVSSSDDDGWGILVRYQDPNNYYRFITVRDGGNGGPFRRLEKFVGGRRTVLVQNTDSFEPGRTYNMRVACRGNTIEVWMDGQRTLASVDSSFTYGKFGFMTYACAGVSFGNVRHGGSTGAGNGVTPTTTTTGGGFSDDFQRSSLGSEWTIVDDPSPSGPSAWSISNGKLVQSSNIYRVGNEFDYFQGTHIVANSSGGSDYELTCEVNSADNDGWGILVRYQDPNNYYRFLTVQDGINNGPFRRLEKFVGGRRTILAENRESFEPGRTYDMRFVCRGNTLEVWMNGQRTLATTDSSFTYGKIGFMTYACAGVSFSNVRMGGGSGAATTPTTSTGTVGSEFPDDVEPGMLGSDWTVVDDPSPSGPSDWSISDGKLVQSSNIYRVGNEFDYYQGTHAVANSSGGSDYEVTCEVSSSDDDGWGILVRYQDPNNYYRFITVRDGGNGGPFRRLEKLVGGRRTVLVENRDSFDSGRTYNMRVVCRGNTIEVWMDGQRTLASVDPSFTYGKIGFMTYACAGVSFSNVRAGRISGTVPVGPSQTEVGFSGDFKQSTLGSDWTIVDDPSPSGPSDWSISNGKLVQSSNIYRVGNEFDYFQGTHIVANASGGSDYEVTCGVTSSDDDGWGILVRYQDPNNYYRFITLRDGNNAGPFRRIEKFVGGRRIVLAENRESYDPGRTYSVRVVCKGNTIEVWMDGQRTLTATDYSFASGKIGFMTYACSGVSFDNIGIGKSPGAGTNVTPPPTTTSGGGSSGEFNISSLGSDWTIVDDPNPSGASDWSISNGKLVQSSNIYRVGNEFDYFQGTHIVANSSSGSDYEVTCDVTSSDDDGWGILVRYQDPNNYYRFITLRDGNNAGPFRRIEKYVAGRRIVLAENKESYEPGRTYNMRVVCRGNTIEVWMDGQRTLGAVDPTFTYGRIGFMTYACSGVSFGNVRFGGTSGSVSVTPPTTQTTTTSGGGFSDNFQRSSLGSDWTVVDDPYPSGASDWSVSNGKLVQSSNIFRTDREYEFFQGTHVVANASGGSDYEVTCEASSPDDDGWGILVRYQDPNNYYRFITVRDGGNGGPFRRLEKFVGGQRTVLAENRESFEPGRTHNMRVVCRGNTIEVWMDGVRTLSATDYSFASGKIGLMAYACTGLSFSNVRVGGISGSGANVTSTTMSGGGFSDDFQRSSLGSGWTVVDDPYRSGPSDWSVSNGKLVQSSNIFRTDREYEFFQGTHIIANATGGSNYEVTCEASATDDDGWGILVRYQDPGNYYRFITVRDSGNRGPFRRLERFVDGQRTVLVESRDAFEPGRTYNVRVVCRGNTIEVWMDGQRILGSVDPVFTSGKIGFMAYACTGLSFDNLKVVGN